VGVLRFARRVGATCVLGNHDLHLLACATGVAKLKKYDTIGDVLSAKDRDALIDWLATRPFLVRDGATVMAHAGIAPFWTVDQAEAVAGELAAAMQADRRAFLEATARKDKKIAWRDDLRGADRWVAATAALTRMRCVTDDGALDLEFKGSPAEAPRGVEPWFRRRAFAGERILFGHWAALGLAMGEGYAALDSGCVWGQALTALRLDDGKVFSEPTAKVDRPAHGGGGD
jgi:bis(5'-nucleosyl)-tetraphosphatase (symmetrical)